MLETAIIVFREALEASLIISIVLAAARGIAGRRLFVWLGVAAGAVGALLVAGFAGVIANAASGMGQEVLNATILLLAAMMLTGHGVWMARHGAQLGREAGAVGRAIAGGSKPLWALSIVTGTAVLREGSETALFLFGIAHEGGLSSAASMAVGAALGFAGAVGLGAVLYAGLARIPLHRVFGVTNIMILLLAAGMAAQAAGFLVQADILPPLGHALWNSSAILSENSILGRVLHALVGYVARPAPIQLVFYVGTLALAMLLKRLNFGTPSNPSKAAMLAALLVPLAAPPARADQFVRSPAVNLGEYEFEQNSELAFDPRRDVGRDQSYTFALAATPFSFLRAEIEGETAAPPGGSLHYAATTLETYWQLTESGEYWADWGAFAEYSQGHGRGASNSFVFGPLVQKDTAGFFGHRLLHTANIFLEREVGPNASPRTGFDVAWQSRLLLDTRFQPGVEIYGVIDDVGHGGNFNQQGWQVGPVIAGSFRPFPIGKIQYELGYQMGASNAAPNGALRWKFEYEIAF